MPQQANAQTPAREPTEYRIGNKVFVFNDDGSLAGTQADGDTFHVVHGLPATPGMELFEKQLPNILPPIVGGVTALSPFAPAAPLVAGATRGVINKAQTG